MDTRLSVELKTENVTVQINDFIYQFAKKNDKKALLGFLDSLLEVNTCIKHLYAEFNIAVRRIAFENNQKGLKLLFEVSAYMNNPFLKVNAVAGAASGGHLDLVMTLIEEGASLKQAFFGAIDGNQQQIIEKLIDHPKITVRILRHAAWYAAFRGKKNLLEIILPEGDLLNQATYGAASGGHVELMEDLIIQGDIIELTKSAVLGMVKGGLVNDSTQIIRFLALVHNTDIRQALEENLKSNKYYKTYDILEISTKANELATFIQTRQISLEQKDAWDVPEIQGVLAFCRLSQDLPFGSRNAYFLLAAFLAPHELIDENKIEDMFSKMQLDIRKVDVMLELDHCYLESGYFGFFRNERPLNFKQICKTATSDNDLDNRIRREFNRCAKKKDDPYVNLLRSFLLFQYRDPNDPINKFPTMNPVFDDNFYQL